MDGPGKDSVSEYDVDSLCGMLIQLKWETRDGLNASAKEREGDGKNGSILWITKKEKIQAAELNALNEIILSENDEQEKELLVTQLLGDLDIDPNQSDEYGRTPLMYSMFRGEESVISSLLQCNRVNLLTRDLSGNTALMYGSVRGNDGNVRMFMNEFKRRYKKDSAVLLDYLDVENDQGDTAIGLALRNGHEDCAVVLSGYLKEALAKEERRLTSLSYRMGLRCKSECRLAENQDPPNTEKIVGKGRSRSASMNRAVLKWKSLRGLGRRTRNASRHYASEFSPLLDSDSSISAGSPQERRAATTKIENNSNALNDDLRRVCNRHRDEDRKILLREYDTVTGDETAEGNKQ